MVLFSANLEEKIIMSAMYLCCFKTNEKLALTFPAFSGELL